MITAVLGLAAIVCGPSMGQELHGTIDGRLPADLLAFPVGTSDVDGDGLRDIVVVAAAGAIPGPPSTSADADVYWYSGVTLRTVGPPVFGTPGSDGCRAAASAGDFDGDGVDDLAWHRLFFNSQTLLTSPEVHVESGATRQRLALFPDPGILTWGEVIAPLGDVDQDGYDDIIVGGVFSGSFEIYGGPDGHLIRGHYGVGGANNSAASVGDVDGDGVPDYVIGSGSASWVTLFSGLNGAQIRRDTRGALEGFGHSVTGVGDVDGDGVPDYAAGAPGSQSIVILESRAHVVSGQTGEDLRVFESHDNNRDNFGTMVDGRYDVNGDGLRDLMVFANSVQAGNAEYVDVYSLRTGSLLWRRRPPHAARIAVIAMVGDLDGDGLSEWAAVDPNAALAGTNAGRIWIFRGHHGDAEEYCPATLNSSGGAARLVWTGPVAAVSNEQVFEVVGGTPSSFAQVIYGVAQSGVAFGDGVLCIGGPSLYRLDAPFALDANGYGSQNVRWWTGPNSSGPGAWLPGSAWAMQAIYRDIGGPGGTGFNTTSAWRVVFTP